jgi:hypothetical protein
MEKAASLAEIPRPDGPKAAARAAQAVRLRAIGRAQGVGESAIAAAEASLAGAFALGDFMDGLRHMAGSHD